MKAILVTIVFMSVSVGLFGNSDKRISKEEYADMWKQIAIQQMIDYKIPASITLAQGILESSSGNSDLAKKGNNHFGIKCHDWTGDKMYMDDDAKDECFRVYNSSEDSYIDHSKFLTTKSRYSKLFALDIVDYKSWAKGLKDAGYATNPKYPELLIEIIESLKLNELDVIGNSNSLSSPMVLAVKQSNENVHAVQMHTNKVKYVVAKKGDTFYKISKEFNLGLWQLYKYNDFGLRKDVLEEGDIVYLQPKRRRSKDRDKDEIVVSGTTTLRQISQEQALKLESLIKLNNTLSPDEKISKGQKVNVR